MLAAHHRKAGLVPDDTRQPPREALLALNRSVTAARLMAGAIHDVNNALQVISGTVEILQGRTDLPEAVTRALARVRNQSTRAGAALADVLVFTKSAVDESTRLDLREMVDYCVRVRRFAIGRAGLSVRWDIDTAPTCVVAGTRALLQQAVLNLIINAEQALAFTRGTITVELVDEGRWVDVRVSDDGAGVLVEPTERAFEPFVSTREPGQGTGLGLWAARSIAEAHNGTLTIDEGTSGGSFVLRLPKTE
jgi:two-component system NtrC family sensor kinase